MTEHGRLTATRPGLIVRLDRDMTAAAVAAVIDHQLTEPPPPAEPPRVPPLPEVAHKGFMGRWPTLVEFARRERVMPLDEFYPALARSRASSVAALAAPSVIERPAPAVGPLPPADPGATSC